jgi:hypothetical protein
MAAQMPAPFRRTCVAIFTVQTGVTGTWAARHSSMGSNAAATVRPALHPQTAKPSTQNTGRKTWLNDPDRTGIRPGKTFQTSKGE